MTSSLAILNAARMTIKDCFLVANSGGPVTSVYLDGMDTSVTHPT